MLMSLDTKAVPYTEFPGVQLDPDSPDPGKTENVVMMHGCDSVSPVAVSSHSYQPH